jgi:hypothetical protein
MVVVVVVEVTVLPFPVVELVVTLLVEDGGSDPVLSVVFVGTITVVEVGLSKPGRKKIPNKTTSTKITTAMIHPA